MSIACPRCGAPNDHRSHRCLNCGTKLDSPAARGLGDMRVGAELLGRYRILKLLGEGAMGRVYLADQSMGIGSRRVAIKTLQIDLAADPTAVTRFQRECKTVCELDHPNTIKFYDFGKLEDGALFIAMEYIEGPSLAQVVGAGPMSVKSVDRILMQLCGSLAEAHQKGIVHRDLKPDNVLLTHRAGQADFVKVLDFGIAKRSEPGAQQGAQLTMQGTMLGTPPYMSPEQFKGEALDGRSDLYSLAVMVFEMLTGELPFVANTPWEWALKHMSEAPRSLDHFAATAALPAHRKAAVHRALAKNPDDRYDNVHAFLQAFTGVQDLSSAWMMVTSGGGYAPQDTALAHVPAALVVTPSMPLQGTLIAPPPPVFGSEQPYKASRPWSARWWLLAIPIVAAVAIAFALIAFEDSEQAPSHPTTTVPRREPTPTPINSLPNSSADSAVPGVPTHDARSPVPDPRVVNFAQWLAIVHHRGRAESAESALGPTNGSYAVIPSGAFVTLQTASGWSFASDGTPAPDLEVYVDGARSSPYQVELGDRRGHNSFVTLTASAAGPMSMDLDAVGVTATSLVRIRNMGSSPVYLDAVMAHRVSPGAAAHAH